MASEVRRGGNGKRNHTAQGEKRTNDSESRQRKKKSSVIQTHAYQRGKANRLSGRKRRKTFIIKVEKCE